MVARNSHFTYTAPPFLPTSIQNSNQHHSPTLKFTQLKAKETTTLQFLHQQKPNVQTNLDETQQLHGHFIKACSSYSFQLPLPVLGSYSSDAAIYSFLITSYIKNNSPEDALKIYSYMRRTGAEVDNFIVPSVLKACSLIPSSLLGQEVHGFAVKNDFRRDVFVCNALIMMYSEVGSLQSARQLFDKIDYKHPV